MSYKPHVYTLHLTSPEVDCLAFVYSRYSWAKMLYDNLDEHGTIKLAEHEAWQWIDDVEDEGGSFSLANEDLAKKLVALYDSIV